MKRLLAYAILLGAIGGVVKNLRIPIGSYFAHEFALLVIFNSFFGICVCMTRGIAEKSFRTVKRGILFGIIAGILSAAIEAGLDMTGPAHSLISMTLLGIFAGSIGGIVENSRGHIFYGCAGGFFGGALSVLGVFAAMVLTVLMITILELFLTISPRSLFFYVFTPAASGALKSVIIWLFIALADNYYLKRIS
jgi:hypothetical protein